MARKSKKLTAEQIAARQAAKAAAIAAMSPDDRANYERMQAHCRVAAVTAPRAWTAEEKATQRRVDANTDLTTEGF